MCSQYYSLKLLLKLICWFIIFQVHGSIKWCIWKGSGITYWTCTRRNKWRWARMMQSMDYIKSNWILLDYRDDRLRSFLLFLNLSNLEPDPNSVPDNYIEEVYAVEDYTSTDEGGLSFSRGDRVYVLLRNRFGYCTGWSCFVADFLYFYLKII